MNNNAVPTGTQVISDPTQSANADSNEAANRIMRDYYILLKGYKKISEQNRELRARCAYLRKNVDDYARSIAILTKNRQE